MPGALSLSGRPLRVAPAVQRELRCVRPVGGHAQARAFHFAALARSRLALLGQGRDGQDLLPAQLVVVPEAIVAIGKGLREGQQVAALGQPAPAEARLLRRRWMERESGKARRSHWSRSRAGG
ncbi:MAG: hypothetical protein DMF82_12420 [Acidobacteria bacterium]|nr:MAG: hypothetical protein DMF82_12420 [Acidobacteriota bacterium]